VAVTSSKKSNETFYYNGKSHRRAVFTAGLMAGMLFTSLTWLIVAIGLSQRTLANLVADKIASVVPASFTESIIQAIGPLGKELVYYSVLLGQVVVGGLLGLLFVAIWPRLESKSGLFRSTYIFATAGWFVFMLVGLLLLDAGFLGSSLGDNQLPVLINSFLLFEIFGLAFGYLFLYLVPVTAVRSRPVETADGSAAITEQTSEEDEDSVEDRTSRRRFVAIISTVFIGAVGVALGTNIFRPAAATYRTSLGDLRSDGTLEGEITPTGDFYQVSKNAFNPKVDATGWKLQINGLVNSPYTLDFNGIKQLPSEIRTHTLTCISNPVGGPYIGNAEWKGTQLKTILEKAGVKPGAKKVVFTCADNYTDSIPIDVALDPRTLLAYEMNGQQLTDDHGYPARMLIPDIYGMKNAKWITSITVIDTEFEGFWQKQGWDNPAIIKTESSITFPADTDQVRAGQVVTLKGFAFAGARGINKVEVSTDNGQTWVEATVKPPRSDTSWALWRLDWNVPSGSKTYILKVRATDGKGKPQISDLADSFPDGASGYHTISVRAV
jgi:DMSO/TMAO reductase YedYZ molybdopterin-dependent catalytic subunit